jgi:hypothetical protein
MTERTGAVIILSVIRQEGNYSPQYVREQLPSLFCVIGTFVLLHKKTLRFGCAPREEVVIASQSAQARKCQQADTLFSSVFRQQPAGIMLRKVLLCKKHALWENNEALSILYIKLK